jgi:hypothetical protein
MRPTDWTGAESSGLRRVRPQRVEHVDGWAVASLGREAVSYDEGERHAEVGIDRGLPSSRLYVDTLEWVDERGTVLRCSSPSAVSCSSGSFSGTGP